MSFCVFAVKSAVKSAVKLVTIVKDKFHNVVVCTYLCHLCWVLSIFNKAVFDDHSMKQMLLFPCASIGGNSDLQMYSYELAEYLERTVRTH